MNLPSEKKSIISFLNFLISQFRPEATNPQRPYAGANMSSVPPRFGFNPNFFLLPGYFFSTTVTYDTIYSGSFKCSPQLSFIGEFC